MEIGALRSDGEPTMRKGSLMFQPQRIFAALVTTAWLAHAAAADGPSLVKSDQCTACHATDGRVVGPSFKEIAAKYKDEPKAADKLAASINGGSSGKWGPVPMPPNAFVNDTDAHTLAVWILGL